VVLNPEEPKITEALRIIQPDIERIAFIPGPTGGFFLKLSGSDLRLPLGSMGDGLKRLLGLSLHLERSTSGYLLVDEIDAGLHHSIMINMWRMVIETAKRLDVQVLATTHSLDCVHALGLIYGRNPEIQEDVLLHRLERERTNTTPFTAEDILVIAEHHMEVR
jgi:predicted ATPase